MILEPAAYYLSTRKRETWKNAVITTEGRIVHVEDVFWPNISKVKLLGINVKLCILIKTK